MRVTFLGTAAATSFPLMFCRCEACEGARRLGGADFRKRSSLLVNEDLLVDLGPDLMAASYMHGVSMADVRYWLQTHPHSDHFDPSHLGTRLPEYAAVDVPPLTLYATHGTLVRMSEMLRADGYVRDILDPGEQRRLSLEVVPISPHQAFGVGPYRVTAFPSDHDRSADSVLYAISQGDRTIFYGTDTDAFPEETWNGLREEGLRFDLVVLDMTYGPGVEGEGHLNADGLVEHTERMRREGLLEDGARVLATHISHEGNSVHSAMSDHARSHGYEVAFDGLVVQV